jgi:hypothetical protein
MNSISEVVVRTKNIHKKKKTKKVTKRKLNVSKNIVVVGIWSLACRCFEVVFLLDRALDDTSPFTSSSANTIVQNKKMSKKKKSTRNRKKKRLNSSIVLSSTAATLNNKRKSQKHRRNSHAILEWCWSWSLTLLFLLLVMSEEFLVMVNGLEALPDGHINCAYSPYRLSTINLCGIVDIWIAGTYGTVPTAAKTAKDGIVGQYGEIEEWDVSQVTTMKALFKSKSTFNADLSKWQVNNVEDMHSSKFSIPFHHNNAHQIHPYILYLHCHEYRTWRFL